MSGPIQKYNESKGKLVNEKILADLANNIKIINRRRYSSKSFAEHGLNPDNISAQEKYDFLINTSAELLSSKAKEAVEHSQNKPIGELEWGYTAEFLNLVGFEKRLKGKPKTAKMGNNNQQVILQRIRQRSLIFSGPFGIWRHLGLQ